MASRGNHTRRRSPQENRGARDIFLSHRSTDKEFVRRLAGDVESETFQSRKLTTWLDEAEIRPGQSIAAMINDGLEKSRFIGLVLTPDYFRSESGWTDAEWQAAIADDPANRRGRIIPMLAADCPYIPMLLHHLMPIDLRGKRYRQGVKELLMVLREEPLPRPTAYRGQLIAPSGRITRATIVAERAVPDAVPDVVTERLYCNLLPISQLPQCVYSAPIRKELRRGRADGRESLPTKEKLKEIIRAEQVKAGAEKVRTPAFRIYEDQVVTFHDPESPDCLLSPVIDGKCIRMFDTLDLMREEDERRLVVSLLNMAISRHVHRVGLVTDQTKFHRYFFPPKENGPNVISWIPKTRRASRTVAKAVEKDGKVYFWRHLGAYLKMLFLANKYYIHIKPTWVITEDGHVVKGGPDVGRWITKWTGPERNMHVLYHVRFWTSILSKGPGGPTFSIKAGDQWMEVFKQPAFIQEAYGISYDQKDLLEQLDQEATLIAEEEEREADVVAEAALSQETEIETADISALAELPEGEEASESPDVESEEVPFPLDKEKD